MKRSFITVIGNVATGKSTMAEFLAKKLNATLVRADDLYKTNPFFKNAVVDRTRWSLASDIWFLTKRVEMAVSLETQLATRPVVQDSGLLMSWVYANSRLNAGTMNKHETELYNELYETLAAKTPTEDLVLFLNLPVDTLLSRIQARGREFEVKHHSREYLEGLQDTLQTLTGELRARHRQVLELNEANWCDIVRKKEDRERLVQNVLDRLPKARMV